MAEIVNLRRVRKAKARDAAAVQAAENRAKHGRTREERDIADLARRETDRVLARARLDGDSEPGK